MCVYCLECFVKDWVVDVSVCIDCLEYFVKDHRMAECLECFVKDQLMLLSRVRC